MIPTPRIRSLPTTAMLFAGALLMGCPQGDAGSSNSSSAPAAAQYAKGGGGEILPTKSGVAAVVNGTEISFADLDAKAAARLVRVKTQAYEIRKSTLRELVDTQLLEAEAKKRNISSEELLKAEVTDKIPTVSEDEARAFFEKNPRRGKTDFEVAKPRVIEYLQKQQEKQVRDAYLQGLSDAAGVQLLLEPMRFDVRFDPKTDPVKGPSDAPVTIVEFSDFECPYCSRVTPTMKQIETEYADKVKVVFRNFPLPFHKEAPGAALAAQCAHDQGKFWEYHDLLFANQRALQPADLKGYAGELSLDATTFAECFDSGKHNAEIELDKAAGEAVGVSGTPAFFINGQFLNGARPYEDFKAMIDDELRAKGLL